MDRLGAPERRHVIDINIDADSEDELIAAIVHC